jgi:formylglycine-generating enzyme required for sulfatase activity
MGRLARVGVLTVAIGAMPACSSCRRDAAAQADASMVASSGSLLPSSSASSAGGDSGTPRPGMVWIPAGTLRAGTPRGRTPRVADEEMAGAPVEMSGFYIDLLPWPNEPNAIPTSNVSRDEAEQLCNSKGKRLCSELEWERACKGPDNTTYEYGDAYRKDVCGTGVALEEASRRPTGEHAQCKSGFGVAEMHGGVWEWTSSTWGRGTRDATQGVLRGGNSVAGELVGRCSNAIARSPSKKSPTMGLRCCAGTKNPAEVKVDVQGTPGLAIASAATASLWATVIAKAADGGSPRAIDPKSLHAWSWIPVANEELVVAMGCTEAPKSCAFVVVRPGAAGDGGVAPGEVLGTVATGKELSELARNGDARHLRMRSLDQRGVYSRDVTYAYGRVDLAEAKRP